MIKLEDWELRCLVAICSRILSNEEVVAFGSRVSGKTHENSDLDIAIVGDGKLSLMVLADLKEAFEDSDLSFRVDVVDYHRVSEGFQKVIISTGEQLDYR